jgi:hypothetical protein
MADWLAVNDAHCKLKYGRAKIVKAAARTVCKQKRGSAAGPARTPGTSRSSSAYSGSIVVEVGPKADQLVKWVTRVVAEKDRTIEEQGRRFDEAERAAAILVEQMQALKTAHGAAVKELKQRIAELEGHESAVSGGPLTSEYWAQQVQAKDQIIQRLSAELKVEAKAHMDLQLKFLAHVF